MVRVSGARTAQRSAVNAAMSSDLSVQAVAVARMGNDGASDPKVAASESPPQAEPTPLPSPIINPTLRLEPALGLVVIEFRNDSGTITTSIPSQRQIEAYQRWEATRIGPTPIVQTGRSPQPGLATDFAAEQSAAPSGPERNAGD